MSGNGEFVLSNPLVVPIFANGAFCAQLPVVGGAAADGFQKMLRVQWRGAVRHLHTQIDRSTTVPRIRIGLRYRSHFRKGRSAKKTKALNLRYFLKAPFQSTRAVG
ncbi:MAG: hypothetical protein LC676_18940 [Loktanella sp.]|nr:hypothetical protein [Loktanella sp.]